MKYITGYSTTDASRWRKKQFPQPKVPDCISALYISFGSCPFRLPLLNCRVIWTLGWFFPQEDYWQKPHTAWSDLYTSNQPTAKQGTGRWGQNSASHLLYFLLNFFPIQLTKLCNYTFIGQEVSLFPFLASFSVVFPCFTGCSKLNITFKLHNKDLGGIEWMRKVMGREVSAKTRFAKQLHRT